MYSPDPNVDPVGRVGPRGNAGPSSGLRGCGGEKDRDIIPWAPAEEEFVANVPRSPARVIKTYLDEAKQDRAAVVAGQSSVPAIGKGGTECSIGGTTLPGGGSISRARSQEVQILLKEANGSAEGWGLEEGPGKAGKEIYLLAREELSQKTCCNREPETRENHQQ